jgi:hypothetical protein
MTSSSKGRKLRKYFWIRGSYLELLAELSVIIAMIVPLVGGAETISASIRHQRKQMKEKEGVA